MPVPSPVGIPFRAFALVALSTSLSFAADVGSGAPSQVVADRFINAFYRNGFSNLVALPPLADVRRLGSTGLVQEFSNTAKTSGVKLALVTPDAAGSGGIFQVYSDPYSFFNTVGVATAGYPTGDTQTCPAVTGLPACTYQFFSSNYALFAYSTATLNGQNFAIRDPFYMKWIALGGISGLLGLPVDIERAVTSPAKTTATQQLFNGGAIYKITSGTFNTQTFAVLSPINDLFQANGGFAGSLGAPTSDEIALSTGVHRQSFEGGRVEYSPGAGPAILTPVDSVVINGSTSIRLQMGGTFQIGAQALALNGSALAGRTISWATSNSRVVSIQANGANATLTAVGPGVANVTATSEGKSSAPLAVTVSSQCCQVGEGAPSAVQQSFQDAVTRNHLAVVLPAASSAKRSGSGYIQELASASSAGVRYVIARSDKSPNAYLVTGPLLTAYEQAGGVSGALGYPISDATAGSQLFENGAFAGTPLRLLTGPIYTKWVALGRENGAGAPIGDAAPFSSFSGYAGVAQAFSNGVLYGITSGSKSGQAYLVSGLILARYNALGGPAGAFGLPSSDEFAAGGMRRQNFESGYIDYTPGDATAQEHAVARQPAVSSNPGSVVAGSRVHLAITGFANGARLRVSLVGQPDFVVTTPNGAYEWDAFVPSGTRSGAVAIHAIDTTPGVVNAQSADGSYVVKSLMEARPQLKKVQGDGQSGAAGAKLALPLVVSLQDSAGNPIAGIPVAFNASPGGQISPVSAITDANGQASATVRLPPITGLAEATATAAGQLATFAFRAASATLTNFPQMTQAIATPLGSGPATIAQKGALLTSVANLIRYYQARGDLPAPNGLADPASLNQYLVNACVTDAQGTRVCDGYQSNPDSGEQVVNLWRLAGFVGGGLDISIENPDLNNVRDLLAAGSPVLLNLRLTVDGKPAGGTSVVAVGIGEDGSVIIQDPNPALARSKLGDYLAGFAFNGQQWSGEVISAVRLLPRTPAASGFLLSAISQPANAVALDASSPAGGCGRALEIADAADAGSAGSASGLSSRFVYCDGTQPAYQIGVGGDQAFRATLTDLAAGGSVRDLSGSSPGGFSTGRQLGLLTIGPQSVAFSANSVVNAATFGPSISPGALISIFGSGLSGPAGATVVTVGDRPAKVIAASAFQINAQVPPDLAAGDYPVQVQSAFGGAQQQVDVQPVSPGIFVLGATADKQSLGAIVNPDGTVNTPVSPAPRGKTIVIYCTGLGNTSPQGNLTVTSNTVTGILNEMELPSAFSGLTPNFVGLYQVNLPIPADFPPGIGQTLRLRESGVDSNRVSVSIQ